MPPTVFTRTLDEEKEMHSAPPPVTPSRSSFPSRDRYISDFDSDVDDFAAPLLGRDQRRLFSFDSPPSKRSLHAPPSPSSPTSPSSPPLSPSYSVTLRRSRRSKRLASLGYTLAVLVFVATFAFAVVVFGWTGHIVYARWHSYRTRGRAMERVMPEPKPVEELVAAFPGWMRADQPAAGGAPDSLAAPRSTVALSRAGRVEAIQDELDARFAALDLPSSTTLPCSSLDANPTLFARYSPLRGVASSPSHARSGPTFFALNLYNSQHVLPSLSRTLLTLSSFLGPETVHISIFENGSTDNTTVALAHLAAALSALGTPHTIVSDPRKTDWKHFDRIETLAMYRNIALDPLNQAPLNGTNAPQDIVFINDVFVCPADALELVSQRKAQDADAACALDWQPNSGTAAWWDTKVRMYDSWVARSLTGRVLRNRVDLFQEWRDGTKTVWDRQGEEYSRARYEKGVPIPVYSCWNGMVAFTARPFTSSSIAPRYDPASPESSTKSWTRPTPSVIGDEPVRFRAGRKSEGECAASECKIIARDFWNRGFDRWMIVPTVRTTYDEPTYSHRRLVELASRNPPSQSSLSLSTSPSSPLSSLSTLTPLSERIDWPSLIPPQKVVCFGWDPKFMLDLEWLSAVWESPYSPARLVEWGVQWRRWLPW
ncbi:hypothetical protein JCM6882_003597 [Rhodosporidiobolus microsporus]